MKKNGFTLIELLAVIVILAIIALIATPIILGIINDAREKANERSVELYASAVRNGIAAYQLREGKEVPFGSYTTETVPFDIEYDGNMNCYTVDIYEDGGIYIADCKVNGKDIDYAYGMKQEIPIVVGKLNSVCKLVKGTALTSGSKYDCKVDPSKDAYTFYVLSKEENQINLIMDSNIRTGGEAIKEEFPTEEQYGLVAWLSSEDYPPSGYDSFPPDDWNTYGPLTAMTYLNEATQNWTNLNLMTINTFADDTGKSFNMYNSYTTYARMPYYTELSGFDHETGANAYLYGNLGADCYDDEDNGAPCDVATYINGVHIKGMTHVAGLSGYLTLSISSSDTYNFWVVQSYGILEKVNDDSYPMFGVRPVITLSI